LPRGHASEHRREPSIARRRAFSEKILRCPETGQAKKGAAVAGGSKFKQGGVKQSDRSHSMSRRWTLIVMIEKA
jgi:hypothetical protein